MSTVSISQAQTRVHIRWMIRRDMPEVLAIEHASFEFPWCEEEFLRVLRQRNCIGMVAECGERIVGFMIYELHRNRIHVLDFATHPEFRRHGVGRQMVSKLVGKLSTQRRNRIVLCVRETNLPAQLFFRARILSSSPRWSLSFVRAGTRYKVRSTAVIMETEWVILEVRSRG